MAWLPFLRQIEVVFSSKRELGISGSMTSWHTWASWHRQAVTSCDELKDLGGWKSRVMVDRYAKHAAGHLTVAAAKIENGRGN